MSRYLKIGFLVTLLWWAHSALAQDTIPLNTTHAFAATSQPGYSYSWWFVDDTNDTTYFASTTNTTEDYLWNVPGNFELFSQAKDQNNCLSEIISKPFVVKEKKAPYTLLIALPDYIIGYNDKLITGNVSTNDYIETDISYKLIYTLLGEPVPGLIFNPDGSFTYNPVPGFTGKIYFTYKVCFEQEELGCATSEVIIRVLPSQANGNIAPVAVTDIYLTFPNEPVSNNLLFNDVDPDGSNDLLTITTTPIVNAVHGEVQMLANGDFTYIPDQDFQGADRFLYRICDSGTPALCDLGWVYIVVTDFGDTDSKPISTGDDVFLSQEYAFIAGQDTTIASCEPYMLGGVITDEENYNFKWEPVEQLDDPTKANPVFTPGTSTKFILTMYNDNGVEIIDSVYITVSDVLADAGTDMMMLPNSTAILDGTASVGDDLQFNWNTTTGRIESGKNTPNPIVSGFGTYYLKITDSFGCMNTDSVTVQELAQAPVANDDYDTTHYRTEVIIAVLDNDTDPKDSLNPSSITVTMPPVNGTAYVDYNNFTIHYQPNNDFYGNDNFEYQVCNAYDLCDRANVYVMVNDFRFLIPDAFSPNGDGINDYFEILGIEFFEGNSITIINRWGNKVYEAKNYGISTSPTFWDGKANTGIRVGNEELSTGTYFYVLDLGNGEKPIAGSIYLDR